MAGGGGGEHPPCWKKESFQWEMEVDEGQRCENDQNAFYTFMKSSNKFFKAYCKIN